VNVVVAVVGAREAARVGWTVGVPAVDQLRRAQTALDGGELARQLGARAVAAAAAEFAVDGADVRRAAGLVVGAEQRAER
jgi:hypothetical protein